MLREVEGNQVNREGIEARATNLRRLVAGSLILILGSASSYLAGVFATRVALEFVGWLIGIEAFNQPDPEQQLVFALWLLLPAALCVYVAVWVARRWELGAAARHVLERNRRLKVVGAMLVVAYVITWVVGVPAVLAEQRRIRWVAEGHVVDTYGHVSCCALPLLPFVVVNYHDYRTASGTRYLFSGVDVTLWYGTGVRTLAVLSGDIVYVPGVFKTTSMKLDRAPLGHE